MKSDQQEAFEKALASTLVRVGDYLKFAETKNAALLTFSSAWIVGSINLLLKADSLPPEWRAAFATVLPIFVLSAFAALYSFLPKTILGRFHKDPEQAKSLLYFGDIATFAPAAYKERVRERYYPPEGHTSTQNYLDDLSIQIAVTSQITTRKLKIFNFGAVVLFVALCVLFVPAISSLCSIIHEITGK
jgi:hypothetical protein